MSNLFQILATTAVVNADTFLQGWLTRIQSTVKHIHRQWWRPLLFNTDLLVVHISPFISKHGQFVRDKAICRYDLSQICHAPDDTCAYELCVYMLWSDGLFTARGLQSYNCIYFLTKVRLYGNHLANFSHMHASEMSQFPLHWTRWVQDSRWISEWKYQGQRSRDVYPHQTSQYMTQLMDPQPGAVTNERCASYVIPLNSSWESRLKTP